MVFHLPIKGLSLPSEECEKRWYVLQSQARREIAAHKRDSSSTGGGPPDKQLSQVAETVFNVLGHSEISVTGLKEGADSSVIQLMEIRQSMEPSEEPGPSTSQVCDPQPQSVYQISLPAAATPTPSLLDRKLEIETDTLTQHKKSCLFTGGAL
ncbi:hypothetical protein KOW79_018805 [Hemibagrus wyckioides]|uniref:Uncharacterized protein n=1 Tax=Hemibagrus wyckioides TaxID=337641 RepID=A0A9D3N8U8_9TELE|nr:hypothetical protein KOW79_018805 [Hemibagrus wyckioides]